ncbi:glycosyltransferase [Miltoncostaea marina]|uniref:glycosyltransferase n=1 Tax=Miltoncostaea marina TaxID=2843215 RepID=UPI001C3E5C26|nr:glycosyltransferase [Miltoncostaea marina]
MTAPLRIGLVCPYAWPPRDDVAHHVEAEAAALAARGHAVAVLAPARRRAAVADGRARLAAAAGRDDLSLAPIPGEVAAIAVGRALPAGRRGIGDPLDLARGLRTAIAHPHFDVVHLHEPLAPGPALTALRHAHSAALVTFHRPEPLAGAALLLPLIARALARADLRLATSATTAAGVARIAPGDYEVLRPGVDAPAPPAAPAAGPPRLVLIARGHDRVGVRFLTAVLREMGPGGVGEVMLLGPPDAPWRTRAAVPAALRERVRVVPDAGPSARAEVLAGGGLAMLADPADAGGAPLREALAAGCAVIAPRVAAAQEARREGGDAVLLPAWDRGAWAREAGALAADPVRRAALAARARPPRGWDAEAAGLEEAYRRARAARARAGRPPRSARNPQPDS